jgi:DNA gyrase/topoisomerase IV subunit A
MKTSKKTRTSLGFSPVVVSGTKTSDFIDSGSKEYAIYTAQNRAIPSSCDGLKDGQRKALWLMRNRSDKLKTISLAGAMIAENIFHHSDASASETISRLAAPYLNNIPLFDGVGAFGTRVGPDSWGAPRYTYVKRGWAADALLYTDLDIVPQRPNYDGSTQEPVNFLPLIPLVLLNGVSGIAVGWSTEILPHSLPSLVEATLAAIDNRPMPHLVPSFDYLDVTVRELCANSFEFSGRVTVESSTVLRVTELPPDTSLEKFKARLNLMEDAGQISTYIDRSTKFINVEVRVKKGSIDGWTQAEAIEFLRLKSRSTQRIVVLDFNNRSIRQYASSEDLVSSFVAWRLSWYTARFQNIIRGLTRDLNMALAIDACVTGGLPAFLPSAENRGEVQLRVMSLTQHLALEPSQVESIVNLPSHRWSKLSIQAVQREIVTLQASISDHSKILNDPKKIKNVYRREVQSLLKAGQPK